jgi:hypothetical protein
LKSGKNTRLFVSAHGQPIPSSSLFFGDDPWVRPIGDRESNVVARYVLRGLASIGEARVLVAPANLDAKRAADVSAYAVRDAPYEIYEHAVRAGRQIFWRNPPSGLVQSFEAGPDPRGGTGKTRYLPHPETPGWSVAIGTLDQFWVDESELVPVGQEELAKYAGSK